jgi:hypothetical protein
MGCRGCKSRVLLVEDAARLRHPVIHDYQQSPGHERRRPASPASLPVVIPTTNCQFRTGDPIKAPRLPDYAPRKGKVG